MISGAVELVAGAKYCPLVVERSTVFMLWTVDVSEGLNEVSNGTTGD